MSLLLLITFQEDFSNIEKVLSTYSRKENLHLKSARKMLSKNVAFELLLH